MTTRDESFQFSLQTMFGLTLWAASLFLVYRELGLLAAVVLFMGVLHLTVMLRLTLAPLPWSTAWQEVVGMGWLMVAPYLPFAAYLATVAAVRLELLSKDSRSVAITVDLLLILSYLLVPVTLLCALRGSEEVIETAFAGRPRLHAAFQVTRVTMLLGTLIFFCSFGGSGRL